MQCVEDNGYCKFHRAIWFNGQCETQDVLQSVAIERFSQVLRYGPNRDLAYGSGPAERWLQVGHPHLTSMDAIEIEAQFRRDYERYEQSLGKPTWMHLLREEFAEVMAARDDEDLKAELIQLAALCVSWAEKVRERALLPKEEELE